MEKNKLFRTSAKLGIYKNISVCYDENFLLRGVGLLMQNVIYEKNRFEIYNHKLIVWNKAFKNQYENKLQFV